MRSLVAGLLLAALAGPAAAGDVQMARFTTEDGVRIVGSFHPPEKGKPRPAVILLHMYRSDRSAWRPLAAMLYRQGYAVLAIDLRGHGESIEPSAMDLRRKALQRDEELFQAMHRDVAGAYAWLAQQQDVDLSRLALVGASVGCSVAIDYAGRDRSVDVVVCMTPGEDYLGLDSRKHIVEYGQHGARPILLLATEVERKACDTLGKLYDSATVRIVGPGRIHGTHMFDRMPAIETLVTEFVTRHLDEGLEKPVAAAVDGTEYFDVGSPMDVALSEDKRRLFSSAEEAQQRGLKAATGPASMRTVDMVDQMPELTNEPKREKADPPQQNVDGPIFDPPIVPPPDDDG